LRKEHVLAIINSPVISKANHVSLRKLLNDITTNIEALRVQKQAVRSLGLPNCPSNLRKIRLHFEKRMANQIKHRHSKIKGFT
jgi:hypothetical protein